MKKYLILILSVIFAFSCTDLDDINRRLDDHESRLATLEKLVEKTNDDIHAIEVLLNAQNSLLSVISFSELEDGTGYELVMSDGTRISLYNGSDGQAPLVGVKEFTDGNLYWTVNGEYMRDADGNMVIAEGLDGDAGLVPKIRVNTSWQWEVSLDGGKTWQLILDSAGNPVAAKGNDGEVDLQIKETENALEITYNGYTYYIYQGEQIVPVDIISVDITEMLLVVGDEITISAEIRPLYAANKLIHWTSDDDAIATVAPIEGVDSAAVITGLSAGVATITATTDDGGKIATSTITVVNRPKLPIEYLAEYNINEAGDGFVTSHSNLIGGMFNYNDAMDRFGYDKNFTIDGKEYYLPSQEEWFAIVPKNSSGSQFHFTRYTRDKRDTKETVEINGSSMDITSDYISRASERNDSVAYGVRLKDESNMYRSAYRYKVLENPYSEGHMLMISVRYLGPNSPFTIDDVADEAWWADNNEKDIIRYFPLAGRRADDNADKNAVGTIGYYGSTQYFPFASGDRTRVLFISTSFANSDGNMYTRQYSTIRLFSKE